MTYFHTGRSGASLKKNPAGVSTRESPTEGSGVEAKIHLLPVPSVPCHPHLRMTSSACYMAISCYLMGYIEVIWQLMMIDMHEMAGFTNNPSRLLSKFVTRAVNN